MAMIAHHIRLLTAIQPMNGRRRGRQTGIDASSNDAVRFVTATLSAAPGIQLPMAATVPLKRVLNVATKANARSD
jgi:hypothetical protein